MAKIPIYSYDDLRKKADDFLRTYNPTGTIPVPIEEIVEFEFNINIVPVLALQREFEVEGFTSSDLKNIYVDEYVYTNYLNRYRFTLAHEIGHIVLHRNLYRTNRFSSIAEWKEFINSMTEEEHGWIEYQGYAFAGLILVPRENLIKHTNEWVKRIKGKHISIEKNWDFAWELITEHLGKAFQVSSSVIEKRLDKDGIKENYRI
ncbi:MAG TPA: ImmA/IrrE family metallo-endopeptidase [Nitrospirota bacterium]|nr:ImmA/IrrE family metallo-endopeptidase [Nitrospirota bacterium]